MSYGYGRRSTADFGASPSGASPNANPGGPVPIGSSGLGNCGALLSEPCRMKDPSLCVVHQLQVAPEKSHTNAMGSRIVMPINRPYGR